MTSSVERAAINLVDLPGLIQSITSQRRDGIMELSQGKEERSLYFAAGQLVALSGGPPAAFAKALVWSEVMTPDQLSTCISALGKQFRCEQLAQTILSKSLATRDGLLDAVDCYIEEGFCEVIGWTSPKMSFLPRPAGAGRDSWVEMQLSLAVSINPGSLLLEGLRRQDELRSIAAFIPDSWDVLVLDPVQGIPADLPPDAARILAGWRDGLIAGSLFERSLLPPFRATTALAHLRRIGLVRSATASELVTYADAAYAHGKHRDAYGLYRRALALGVDHARIHLHVAELAERFAENELAATHYLTAGQQLTDTSSAIIALRNALRLGSDREAPLTQLLAHYLQLEAKDEAVAILIELASLYEHRADLDQAAKAIRQAQELGADPVNSSLVLARLAAAEGDSEQAALQLELAAHAAQFAGRNEDAITAWTQLLETVPGRCEYARECAELMSTIGRQEEAIAVLRRNLANQTPESAASNEDALVVVYELLVRLCPEDTQAHNWLALAYERRRDRDGATQQLMHIAQAQERSGNDGALAATLERIVELGGNQIEILTQLAAVRSRLRQDALAGTAWCRAVDAALAVGALKEARAHIEAGLVSTPAYLPLRVRQAQVANREGDRATALSAYRAAADLARGAGHLEPAYQILQQIRRLRPDDMLIRVELAELAEQLRLPDLDRILRDVVHCGVRTNNLGLALEHARKRVHLAPPPAFEARSELVELLRRTGDHAGELSTGQDLVQQLLESAECEKCQALLQRLIVSHNRNADLVVQLAELLAALDDVRQAQRFYRHAVCLLQLEGRIADAHHALDQLATLTREEDATLAVAHDLLDKGQAVEWEAIRASLSQDQRRRLADEIVGSGAR
jgi:hypothetical protein